MEVRRGRGWRRDDGKGEGREGEGERKRKERERGRREGMGRRNDNDVAHLDLVQESSGNVCVHVNSLLLLHQLWEGAGKGGGVKEEG